MKYTIFLIMFCFCALFSMAQSQQEMNDEAKKKYVLADKELNVVYQKILFEYKSDFNFIKKLKITQNLWVKFRDAEIEARFPSENPNEYGSFHPVCHFEYLSELTDRRTKDLRVWLDGMQEGNLCSGSVKIK